MRPVAALLTHPRRFFTVFVAGELLLAMAIPFVAIKGYHTLLGSRAGTVVAELRPSDPGWTALVDPTPLIAVVEVDSTDDRARVTGLALVVGAPGPSSSVVLIPAQLTVGDRRLETMRPEGAAEAVGQELGLRLGRIDVMDEVAWAEAFGSGAYQLANPDPVPDGAGGVLFPVGSIRVEGATAAPFLGRPAQGAQPLSVMPRRRLLWQAMIDTPPSGSHPLATDLGRYFGPGGEPGSTEGQVGEGVVGEASEGVTQGRVLELPLVGRGRDLVVDTQAAEQLIRNVVPFPAGYDGDDRPRMRIVDRTGSAPLTDIAAEVAGLGMEVTEIANAVRFDQGGTEIIVPLGYAQQYPSLNARMEDLAGGLGLTALVDPEPPLPDVVTLVVGVEFDLGPVIDR